MPGYDCLSARISPTISPRPGMRRTAWWEKIVLPSTTTSNTPTPAKLVLGVMFSCFLISRLRRPASIRMLIHVKQRLISMFMTPPMRRVSERALSRAQVTTAALRLAAVATATTAAE